MAEWTKEEMDIAATTWDQKVWDEAKSGSPCGSENRVGTILQCEVTALREDCIELYNFALSQSRATKEMLNDAEARFDKLAAENEVGRTLDRTVMDMGRDRVLALEARVAELEQENTDLKRTVNRLAGGSAQGMLAHSKTLAEKGMAE